MVWGWSPVGGGLKLLLPDATGAGDAAGDGDADSASSESSSESLRRSSSLKERSLTPSSRGVKPVSSLGVCLQVSEHIFHACNRRRKPSLTPGKDGDRTRPHCRMLVRESTGRGGRVRSPRSAHSSGQPIAERRLVAGARTAEALQPLQAEAWDSTIRTGAAHRALLGRDKPGSNTEDRCALPRFLHTHMIASKDSRQIHLAK